MGATGGGYVLLHRAILDSSLWDARPEVLKLALTILLKANWKRGETMNGSGRVIVERGQLMTSLPALCRDSQIHSIQTIRSCLTRLKRVSFLSWESTARFRMITVTNYDRYQYSETAANRANNRPATGQQQASNSDRRREEGKKGRTNKRSSDFKLAPDPAAPTDWI